MSKLDPDFEKRGLSHRPSRLRMHPASFLVPLPVTHGRPYSFPFFTNRTRRRGPLVSVPCATLRPSHAATQYVPLHVHSDFSLLDGASQLSSLVTRAEALGVPALALTDHGVLYGAVQLVRMCQDTSVKPIIGNEMYIVNHSLPVDSSVTANYNQPTLKRYHLIVLAKNTVGYRNLVKLTTSSHLSGRVGKGIFARPCINKAQLFQHREGLIVCSACLGGEIPQAILNDDIESARNVAMWYRDVFADDFYLEIQDHGSAEDKKVNPVILDLANQLGIKVIATNDSHFTNCLDAEAHDAMICIQTGKMLTDENRLHYTGTEYFKSVDEMRQCFVDHLPVDEVDKALVNTIGVAEKVTAYELFGATRIPHFPIPPSFTQSQDEYLRHVSREGLQRRLEDRSRSGLLQVANYDAYEKRLEDELDMIIKMGFASYFLVVWDYIAYARSVKIPVGPGRGSVAGSLVAFALRITDIDPIEFNHLFERFLNPERNSMPDIDTDFSVEGRERVISYVSDRYGRDHVAQIITFNRLTSKAVLKDVARVHNVPYADADRLAKLIPVVRGKPATLPQLMSDKTPSKEFKRAIQNNPSYKGWLDKAQRIEGANKTFGVHAAGVVISATPLTDIVPLSKSKHGETITQYAMEDVEALGLLKMDFLGLKNLTIIEKALEFINEGRCEAGIAGEVNLSVDSLPLDDPKTYALLAEGELDGIFQLDASAGMRKVVRELRPSSIEDISSVLALYRPGPLDAGLIPKFIRRKHGQERIEYDHPLLEPILKDTYGIMVYQEQIMRIARDLAGYSLGQADILRRAMGKKKMGEMEREKPKFIAGAEQHGVPTDIATTLFEQMLKFADYCFNKSHSTAYAILTYQTAYLKANFPVEYCAALLRSNMNQSDKLVRYLADANASGVPVRPPSINRSSLGFTVDRSESGNIAVLFGLEAIKSLGISVGTALIEERERNGSFCDIIDLIERVDLRLLNKRSLAALVQAGALDELHPNRKVLIEKLESLLSLRRTIRDKRRRREAKSISEEEEAALSEEESLRWEDEKVMLFADSVDKPDFNRLELLAAEKATLGFYASGHPLSELQDVSRFLGCIPISQVIGDAADENGHDESEQVLQGTIQDGASVILLSSVTDLKHITTAKGRKMGKWTMEDMTGRALAVVFPGSIEILEQRVEPVRDSSETGEESSVDTQLVVEEDARVVVWGTVNRDASGATQIVVDDVQKVEDVQALVATFPKGSSLQPEDLANILQHEAMTVLGTKLNSESQQTYVDPDGEVRTRRRRKSPPLSLKNRIPLVLEYKSSDGTVRYINVGSNVRFPNDFSSSVEKLTKSSGFHLRLVSVGKDIIENPSWATQPEVETDKLVTFDPVTPPLAIHENHTEQALPLETEAVEILDDDASSLEGIEVLEPDFAKVMEFFLDAREKTRDRFLDSNDDEKSTRRNTTDVADPTIWDEDHLGRSQISEADAIAHFQKDVLAEGKKSKASNAEHPALSHIHKAKTFRKKDTFMDRQWLYPSQNIANLKKHDCFENEGRYTMSDSRNVATIEKPKNSIGKGGSEASAVRSDIKFDSTSVSSPVSNAGIKSTAVESREGASKIFSHPNFGGSGANVNPRQLELDKDGNENAWSQVTSDGTVNNELGSPETLPKSYDGREVNVQYESSFLPGRRGRSRKVSSGTVTSDSNEVSSASTTPTPSNITTKRKRGRPRKTQLVASRSSNQVSRSGDSNGSVLLEQESESTKDGTDDALSDDMASELSVTNDNGADAKSAESAVAKDLFSNSQATNGALDFKVTSRDTDDHSSLVSETHSIPDAVHAPGTYSKNYGIASDFDDATNGIVIDYDNLNFDGVLDAVSLVASAVVSDSFECAHTITCMSSICLDNLIEDGIFLHVTGRIVYFRGTTVCVLVDVRETAPSGKRKRVRSFGPIAVVLETEKDIGISALATKKAKNGLSTFVQKIGKCYDLSDNSSDTPEQTNNGTASKGRGRKGDASLTINSSEAGVSLLQDFSCRGQVSRPVNLYDGGELLRYMARAAEVCAKKSAQDMFTVSVGTLEWLVISSPATLEDIQSVCVRTHLEGLSFGTMKIQVEAEVVMKEGKKQIVMAVFNVRCENNQVSKRLRVRGDDVPLFDRREVFSKFSEIEKNLAPYLR